MSYVVSLLGYTPPARADNVAFTKARIEEAAVAAGPFSTLQTLELNPVDADPEHPSSRDLTTSAATIASGGFYRVTWIDGAGNSSSPTAPVENADELAGGVRPTVTDVANLLRARTKTSARSAEGAGEAGTFNSNTRPTGDQVDGYIDDALDEVLGKVQTPTPEQAGSTYERRVRGAVALYAAILIENSLFPEQIGTGQSAAPMYVKLYESRIKALIAEGETGEAQGMGGEGPGGASSPGDAAYAFPMDAGGQISLGTRT